jgi:hypothetical protein
VKGWAAAIVAAGLSGCAGTDTQIRMLEQSNAVRVEPATTPDANYIVSVRNLIDIGYDLDDKATRDDLALRMLRTQCPGGQIAGETAIDTGTYGLGRASRTYAIKVRCPAGSAPRQS